jgi:hypothetical protein
MSDYIPKSLQSESEPFFPVVNVTLKMTHKARFDFMKNLAFHYDEETEEIAEMFLYPVGIIHKGYFDQEIFMYTYAYISWFKDSTDVDVSEDCPYHEPYANFITSLETFIRATNDPKNKLIVNFKDGYRSVIGKD